jgi:hypothetical protein
MAFSLWHPALAYFHVLHGPSSPSISSAQPESGGIGKTHLEKRANNGENDDGEDGHHNAAAR